MDGTKKNIIKRAMKNHMILIENPKTEEVLDTAGFHSEITVVELTPGTDVHNNPVSTKKIVAYRGEAKAQGKIFLVRSPLERRSLVIASVSPDAVVPSISLSHREVTVQTGGCPFAYGYCNFGEEERMVRDFFGARCPRPVFSMVNNWGDENCGDNISEEFYYREIDAAAELGIDVVQIDDGWQIGSSQKERIYDAEGNYTFYHTFHEHFWELNREKFPNGFAPLIAYAKEKNVALGLWFAPDSREEFANFERDVKVLKWAYDCGFRYFKLDMVIISSMKDRDRFVALMEAVHAFGPDVYLQIDVTGEPKRLGYTDGTEYGKTFVENRSCKRACYYTHNTMRNLWKLAHYFPAGRFQFEVPNRKHFTEYYEEGDVLAPITYGADYQFAAVMVSNPLIWMEVQHLDREDQASMKRVLDVWKEQRDRMSVADVCPIGEEPDGASLTGFLITGEKYGYLLAFREVTDRDTFMWELPEGIHDLQLLVGTDHTECELLNHTAKICFTQKRAYAFCGFQMY